MMTPFQSDLVKYSRPTAPTANERQALRDRRKARRAAFAAFIKTVRLHASRWPVEAKRTPVNAQS